MTYNRCLQTLSMHCSVALKRSPASILPSASRLDQTKDESPNTQRPVIFVCGRTRIHEECIGESRKGSERGDGEDRSDVRGCSLAARMTWIPSLPYSVRLINLQGFTRNNVVERCTSEVEYYHSAAAAAAAATYRTKSIPFRNFHNASNAFGHCACGPAMPLMIL